LVLRTSFRGWRGPLRRPFQSDRHGEALYTSKRFETAWLEAQQGFAFKAQPLTLIAYDVDCDDVADLTQAATCAGLGVSGNDLACAWEDLVSRGIDPPSWQIARHLYNDGTAAIIVPSYAPGANEDDINVVFWRWSDIKPHSVRAVDDQGRLPRNDASWR
jgi:RES domain-containing protein